MVTTPNDLEWHLISAPSPLPTDLPPTITHLLTGDYESVFKSEFAQSLLGKLKRREKTEGWSEGLGRILEGEKGRIELLALGVAALHAFLQANVTGPPLEWEVSQSLVGEEEDLKAVEKAEVLALSVDGEAIYHLTPQVLLFSLAKTIFNSSALENTLPTWRWWKIRTNFLHQRLLTEPTNTLQSLIFANIDALRKLAPWSGLEEERRRDMEARFLIEHALAQTYFGKDVEAQKALEAATQVTGFEFVLTGVMGKRTKFQEKETSQLVVLAKSALASEGSKAEKPKNLDLNDDTLLDAIAFNKESTFSVEASDSVPQSLKELDPSEQPELHPLDSAILLLLTETIKNTNPASGITREEMLPYAERVLQHSNNWEVYTRALLVRSRIEGYKTRTIERGLLQLQALVDQIIADTSSKEANSDVTTFLPKPEATESASVQERLAFIFQLPIPTRWDLERELADRWTSLGGLRTALEIYERLELWAEVALCWAATEREDKAKKVIERQLYEDRPDGVETERVERNPLPPNAPRLLCILGDIESNPKHYERAWEVSNHRYSRAKRSLGRHYLNVNDYQKAEAAYKDSVSVSPLQGTAWFALGCCRLELEDYDGAVEAFGRTVSIEDDDAEAWSNLATALLRRNPTIKPKHRLVLEDDEEENDTPQKSGEEVSYLNQNRLDALKALKRASTLKYDSWRIWENYLTVAASTIPPSFPEILQALGRIIEIRKDKDGEKAIDVDVLEGLVRHIITTNDTYDPNQPGLARHVVQLVDKEVIPLITSNSRLWVLVGRLAQWRRKFAQVIDCYEKAYRVAVRRYELAEDNKEAWEGLVDASIELVEAFETFGPMERADGVAAGELVCKQWKFKARSIVRSVLSKGKMHWEGSESWGRLETVGEGLKG